MVRNNSLVIATIVTVSSVFFDSLVGYTLCKYRFKGRYIVFIAILSTLMIPTEMLVIPWYIMSKTFGWLDTYWGIMFPGLMTAFGHLPDEAVLRDRARRLPERRRGSTGSTSSRSGGRSPLPLVTPALSALAIFVFLGNWTAFIWPLIVTTDYDLYTLPVGLTTFSVEQQVEWELIMTGASLATIPTPARLPASSSGYIIRGGGARGSEGLTSMAPRPPRSRCFPGAGLQGHGLLAPLFEGAKRHHLEPFRRVNRAHCVMLGRDRAADARPGLGDRPGPWPTSTPTLDPEALSFTGEVEDFFFLIEGELIRRLGVDLAGRLHTGRSRNDIDHTVFKLTLKARIDALAQAGRALAAVLLDKAAAERDTLIVAYTHGQPAQPSTFGHYLSAAAEVLLRDLDRLAAARGTVDLCSMGAAAITTTGVRDRPAPQWPSSWASRRRRRIPTAAIAAVDYVTCTYSALQADGAPPRAGGPGPAVLDRVRGRPAARARRLRPDQLDHAPRSAIRWPIEHLRLLLSLAGGRAAAQLGTMHNTPFTDMNDSEGEVQVAGYAAFEALDRALRLMAGLIGAVTVDADRVRATTDAACITITELADGLGPARGAVVSPGPRDRGSGRPRDDRGAAVAGRGRLSGLRRRLRALGRKAAIGRPGAFAEMVSPEHFVAVRDRFGGPAPAALGRRARPASERGSRR